MAEYQTVPVALGARSYEIRIGNGLLAEAGAQLADLLPIKRAFILTDAHVAHYHLNTLENSLADVGVTPNPIVLPAGEGTKSYDQLQHVLETLLGFQPERKDVLIALGGGVIGDLTGFAASVLLRGVGFIQIPTTLLAMVDSSVGGKTGINSPHGKNLIGSFYQPGRVLADMSVLETLPPRELLAGYAEVAKYAVLGDRHWFEVLEKQAPAALADGAQRPAFLQAIVKKSCEAKAAIVAQDERESGVRALLNLGHTFGHALEAETGFSSQLLHGEGVALGMVLALAFSAHLGLCPVADMERLKSHLKAVGLPVTLADREIIITPERMIQHMRQDKKVSAGRMVFILTRGIGEAFISKDVDEAVLQAFLASMTGD
ncbi:MAG: 3-dehydroquinate synthase [Hyphomicrobiales bacterium]|nr:3-dehydroquinate synthase [Hyphomicrobiales bacterium]